MATIKKVFARQVFDSRGNPTVECEITTDGGIFRAMVPSGASTGVHEAIELRDKGPRYMGKGVSKAVANVNEHLGPAVIGKDVTKQAELDKFMIDLDGTKNKAKFGANAVLSISLAACRAAAAHLKLPLYEHIGNLAGTKGMTMPVPSFNVINGGSHAGNALAMQEFMILPVGAKTFEEAMMMGTETYHNLKAIIKEKYGQDAANVGDEGGFAPNILDNVEGLQLLSDAIKKAGYEGKVKIGMDIAASEFYVESEKKYDLYKWSKNKADSKLLTGEELGNWYKEMMCKFPIISLEDVFDQDDWENWVKFTAECGKDLQIVGDDLLVTNPEFIKRGIEMKACNSLLLKVNQIGTLTESIEAANLAHGAGWTVMVSHRSGETEDSFIADLVVGLATGQIKTGSTARSDRLAKYNQLLRIEGEAKLPYVGENLMKRKTCKCCK